MITSCSFTQKVMRAYCAAERAQVLYTQIPIRKNYPRKFPLKMMIIQQQVLDGIQVVEKSSKWGNLFSCQVWSLGQSLYTRSAFLHGGIMSEKHEILWSLGILKFFAPLLNLVPRCLCYFADEKWWCKTDLFIPGPHALPFVLLYKRRPPLEAKLVLTPFATFAIIEE